MRATRRLEFDAGHRLVEHDGKCRRLHGHRYAVEVTLEGDTYLDGPQAGMVLDFARIDAVLQPVVDGFDHRTMLQRGDALADALGAADPDSVVIVDFPPTAENLAAYFGELASGAQHALGNARVTEVTVWETPRSRATWTAP